jgi:hypothetical protein
MNQCGPLWRSRLTKPWATTRYFVRERDKALREKKIKQHLLACGALACSTCGGQRYFPSSTASNTSSECL